MERRSFFRAGIAGLMAVASGARAQPAGTARIGFLNNINPDIAADNLRAFRQGMQDLGWVEGKNLVVEYRWADGDMRRHAALAADLVRLRVAVIVTAGVAAIQAALRATTTIPIVVTIMPDPVRLGFAKSLARPGGNVTGLTNIFEELTPKQLQILQEAMPGLKRIAMLSDNTMKDGVEAATHAMARKLGVTSRVFDIAEPDDLDRAFTAAKADRADAVVVLPSPVFFRYRARIAELGLRLHLPTLSESSEYVKDGGLLSYGPNFPAMYQRAATYVDRILKGARPGDLPIEQPTKFELVVNLSTARSLGVSLPDRLLLPADGIIGA